jgi:hypothetical protein
MRIFIWGTWQLDHTVWDIPLHLNLYEISKLHKDGNSVWDILLEAIKRLKRASVRKNYKLSSTCNMQPWNGSLKANCCWYNGSRVLLAVAVFAFAMHFFPLTRYTFTYGAVKNTHKKLPYNVSSIRNRAMKQTVSLLFALLDTQQSWQHALPLCCLYAFMAWCLDTEAILSLQENETYILS